MLIVTGSGQVPGAIIEGPDLAQPLTTESFDGVLRALGEYGVIRFPAADNQPITKIDR